MHSLLDTTNTAANYATPAHLAPRNPANSPKRRLQQCGRWQGRAGCSFIGASAAPHALGVLRRWMSANTRSSTAPAANVSRALAGSVQVVAQDLAAARVTQLGHRLGLD